MSEWPNVNDYDETGRPPILDKGDYILKVDDIKRTDKEGVEFEDQDGIPFLNFVFLVKGQKNKLFERVYLTAGGPYGEIHLGKLKQMLIAMGASTEGGEIESLLGKTCTAYVTINAGKGKNEGKSYNNIGEFKPLDAEGSFGESPEEDAEQPF